MVLRRKYCRACRSRSQVLSLHNGTLRMTFVAGPILEDSLRWTSRNRSGFDLDLKIFTGPIPSSIQRNCMLAASSEDGLVEAAAAEVPSPFFSWFIAASSEGDDLSPFAASLWSLSSSLPAAFDLVLEIAAWNWVDDWTERLVLFLVSP